MFLLSKVYVNYDLLACIIVAPAEKSELESLTCAELNGVRKIGVDTGPGIGSRIVNLQIGIRDILVALCGDNVGACLSRYKALLVCLRHITGSNEVEGSGGLRAVKVNLTLRLYGNIYRVVAGSEVECTYLKVNGLACRNGKLKNRRRIGVKGERFSPTGEERILSKKSRKNVV